jgi:hypothetical protein
MARLLREKRTVNDYSNRLQYNKKSKKSQELILPSCVGDTRRTAVTFYGLGYHEERERWITKERFWYRAHTDTDMLQQQIYKDGVRETPQRHLESIQPYIERNTQTQRGMIFEILAYQTIATLSKLLTLLQSLARGQTLGVW